MIQCKINFQKTLCVLSIPLYLSSTFSVDAGQRDSFSHDGYEVPLALRQTDTPSALRWTYENIDKTQMPQYKSEAQPFLTIKEAQKRDAKRRADHDFESQPFRDPLVMTQGLRSKDSGCLAHIKRNKKRYLSLGAGGLLLAGTAAAAAWWGGALSGNEIQSVPDPKCAVDTEIIFTGDGVCQGRLREDLVCFRNPGENMVCRQQKTQAKAWIKAAYKGQKTPSKHGKIHSNAGSVYSCAKSGDTNYVPAPQGFNVGAVLGNCLSEMAGSLIHSQLCDYLATCARDGFLYFLKPDASRDTHTIKEETFLPDRCPPGMQPGNTVNIDCGPKNAYIDYPLDENEVTVRGYCDRSGSLRPCITKTSAKPPPVNPPPVNPPTVQPPPVQPPPVNPPPVQPPPVNPPTVQPPVQPLPPLPDPNQCDSPNPTVLASGMTLDMRTQKNCDNKQHQQCWRIQGSSCEVFVEPLAGCQSQIISNTGEYDRYKVSCQKAMKCKPNWDAVKCTETNLSRTFEVIVKPGKRFIQSWQESGDYPFAQEPLRKAFGEMHKLWYDTVNALETYQGLFFRHDVVEGVLCGRGPVDPRFTVSCASTIQSLPDLEGLQVSWLSYIQMDPRQNPRGTALHEIQHPLANSDTRFRQHLIKGSDGRTYHKGPYTQAANNGQPVRMQKYQSVHIDDGYPMEKSAPSAYEHVKAYRGSFAIAGLKDIRKTVDGSVQDPSIADSTQGDQEDQFFECRSGPAEALFGFDKDKASLLDIESLIAGFFAELRN